MNIYLSIIFVFFFFLQSYTQILLDKTKIIYNNDKLTTTVERTLKINNKEEAYLGEIYLPHEKNSDFKILYAEITDKTGKIVYKLKRKNILTRSRFSSSTFHQDDLVSEIKLFHNVYPYTIKYSYQESNENFFYISYWYPNFNNSYTPVLSKLEVDIPSDLKFNLIASDNLNFKEHKVDNRLKLEWNLDKIKGTNDENFSPVFYETVPSVIITPVDFFYGVKGNQSSWSNYGDWFLELNKNKVELTGNEKTKVDSLIVNKTNDLDKIKALYKYLQKNTEYVNVSINYGGYESYPASYVCNNKYGDCKALTTYMKALLEYSNIKSNYVLINSGNRPKLKSELPSSQFNHVILGVNLGDKKLFLENTSKNSPFNYIGTSIQNKKALWIEEHKSKIIEMPKMSIQDVLNKVDFSFRLDDNDNFLYQMNKTLRSKEFEKYSYLNLKSDREKLENEIFNSIPLKNHILDDWSIDDKNYEGKFIKIQAEGSLNKSIKKIGNITAIKPPVIELKKFKSPINRKNIIRFNRPINYELISKYDLSNFDYSSIKKINEFNLVNNFGNYSFKVDELGNSLVFKEKLTIFKGDYSIEDYKAFYDFIQSIKNNQKNISLILKK